MNSHAEPHHDFRPLIDALLARLSVERRNDGSLGRTHSEDARSAPILFTGKPKMSDYVQNGSPVKGANIIEEPKSDLKTAAASSKRSTESSASGVRTWAWGRAQGPYDWMDAHTPSGDLTSWR